MPIDTQTKRRSVSGYSGIIIAPLADGTIGSLDREHIAGLYAGIAASAPTVDLPYVGDTTNYSGGGAIGSISGATLLAADARYSEASATGSISGATVLTGEPYSGAGATGSTSGATILGEDTRYG